MHYKELTGKPYLAAEDLKEGQEAKLVIEDAFLEDAFNPRTKKPVEVGVIKFVGKTLKMVLNTTNGKAIAQAYGTETNGWKGKEVILYRTTTKLGREVVPCLRIKVDK